MPLSDHLPPPYFIALDAATELADETHDDPAARQAYFHQLAARIVQDHRLDGRDFAAWIVATFEDDDRDPADLERIVRAHAACTHEQLLAVLTMEPTA